MIHLLRLILVSCCLAASLPSAIAQHEEKKQLTDGVEMVKKTKFALLTYSLTDRRAENSKELLTHYLDQKFTAWNVSTDFGYLIDRNFAVGLGFSYGETNEENTTENTLGIRTSFDGNSHQIEIRPFIKNFIPLTDKNQIFIILQTEFQYAIEKSESESMTLLERTTSESTRKIYGLGFRPGLLLFVVKNFALETNVNVLGIQTSVFNGSSEGQPDTKVVTTNIDFKISLLQLNFGFSMYF